MRENFDYVTMDTYSADMAEHTQRAAGIIEVLKRRAEDAERLVAILVLAAGGTIKVHEPDLHDWNHIELKTWRNVADMSFVWEATRKLTVNVSKRKDLERSCQRKIRYAAEPAPNASVRPYHCPICDGWHMTSGGLTGRQRYQQRRRERLRASR